MSSHPFDLVIGLDRSDTSAELFLIDTRSGRQRSQTLSTAPEALQAWIVELRQQSPQARVAICLEQPAVNLIAFLEPCEWVCLYPINPITLQKFREAFVTSRAKDDGKDAEYLARLLWTHHPQLTPWQPQPAATCLLRQLVVHRRAVVDERTGLSNRLKALLKHYFPQALELCGPELWRPMASDFLLKWPTLQAVRAARVETLKRFYHLHGSRSQKLMQQRLELIQRAVALTDDPALLESFTLRVQLLARQLRLVTRTVADYDKKIAAVFGQHPDRDIFGSLPGAGPVFAPRLLASVGSQRERFASAAALQHYSGVAPVTKQSGGSRRVHRRYRCPKFLRQSFHEYAQESILHSRWAAAYYQQQRQKGCPHHTAVRGLAYKWQRIIWRCWQDHTTYQEPAYEAALRQSGSPLAGALDQIELGRNPFKTRVNNSETTIAGSPQR